MNNPFDDILQGLSEQAQGDLAKQARKVKSAKRKIVHYTTPEGEGKASVITSDDGTQFFVKISLIDDYTEDKEVVSVSDSSPDDALRNAADEFQKYGSISLTLPADE